MNAGRPRVHAHPRNKEVKAGDTVMIDVMPSYNGYYSELADTVFVGTATGEKKNAYQAFLEATEAYARALKAETPLDELEKIVQDTYICAVFISSSQMIINAVKQRRGGSRLVVV